MYIYFAQILWQNINYLYKIFKNCCNMIFKCKIAKNQINLLRWLKYILVQGIDVEIESS